MEENETRSPNDLERVKEDEEWNVEFQASIHSQKKKKSEQANKVAREYISSLNSPSLIEQFTTPPAIIGCGSNCDDIACLEIKLFFNGGSIVIQCFD